MRIMYDGIIPGQVPAGAQLYAAYLDGNWPDFAALVAQHPGAIGVPISVSASYDGGVVLDVETGDATPAESVNWVLMRRHAGVDPTVYCNTSTWPAVRAAFQTHDVPEPHYWLAQYDNAASIPSAWSSAGVVAKQYADRGGYDVSVVADYWPGVDPAPTTQGVTMTPAQEAQLLAQVANINAVLCLGGGSTGLVPPGAPNNSFISKLDYLVSALAAIAADVKQLGIPQVDAAALAAVLVPLLPTAEQIATAVLAAQGAADVAAVKG